MSPNKTKIYLGFLIFSIIFGAIVRFALIPLAGDFQDSSLLVDFSGKALKLFFQRTEDFAAFKNNKPYYENIRNELDGCFARADAPISFIEFLEEEAENFKLSIRIQPMAIKTETIDLWQPVGFQVSLLGSFPASLKFLERVERGPFLSDILQININKVSEEKLKQKEFETAKAGDVSVLLAIKVFSDSPPEVKKQNEN